LTALTKRNHLGVEKKYQNHEVKVTEDTVKSGFNIYYEKMEIEKS